MLQKPFKRKFKTGDHIVTKTPNRRRGKVRVPYTETAVIVWEDDAVPQFILLSEIDLLPPWE